MGPLAREPFVFSQTQFVSHITTAATIKRGPCVVYVGVCVCVYTIRH